MNARAGTDPLAYRFAGEPRDENKRANYHRARWLDGSGTVPGDGSVWRATRRAIESSSLRLRQQRPARQVGPDWRVRLARRDQCRFGDDGDPLYDGRLHPQRGRHAGFGAGRSDRNEARCLTGAAAPTDQFVNVIFDLEMRGSEKDIVIGQRMIGYWQQGAERHDDPLGDDPQAGSLWWDGERWTAGEIAATNEWLGPIANRSVRF